MSFLLKINHCHHGDNFGSLQNYFPRELNLVGYDSQEGSTVHKIIFGSASGFLKDVMDDVPISELGCILLPDFNSEIINSLVMFLYNGTLQCSRNECYDVIDLLQLLCINCDSEHITLTDTDGNSVQFGNEMYNVEYETNISHDYHAVENSADDCVNEVVQPMIDKALLSNNQVVCQGYKPGPSARTNGMTEFLNPEGIHAGAIKVKKEDLDADISSEIENIQGHCDSTNVDDGGSNLEILFSCSECDKSFSSALFLQAHSEKHKRGCFTRLRPKCSLCQFVCDSPHELRKHKSVAHSEQFKFKCHICPKLFVSKSNLSNHVSGVHGPKKFKCILCDFSCGFSYGLKQHVACVHSNDTPHACQICGKCFKFSADVIKHFRSAHGTI